MPLLALTLLVIPLLPLCGASVNGLMGKRFSRRLVNFVALTPVMLSFLASLYAFSFLINSEAQSHPGSYCFNYFNWIQSGHFSAPFGFLLDPLTAVMLLVISGIGLIIHVYATGYMKHEGGYYRFFSYLNLFMFSMLLLVLANNFLLMFVGWEGVGLCSYLLIGFYFRRESAASAGKKAFIVNRVGDFGFIIAIFLIYYSFGSLDFSTVFNSALSTSHQWPGFLDHMTLICVLLFVGATGKSAQIPLFIWLPDAMEGPTPVSALIHAATMVTAGVYMVARCHALFVLSPLALNLVAVIGLATALMAASIGLAQNDIKKILAYSTVSQLGFMFLGCGVGAFSAGIFHLITHAFFKALLFLGAGSVIHAMGGEQDIRKMGALRGKLPITSTTMLGGTLAIAGFFPFAGFFSKDEILWQTLLHGHWLLWCLGVLAAAMTSFYMFRMIFLTFFGESRLSAEAIHHLHESPRTMTVPLQILAVGALAAGWLGLPQAFHMSNLLDSFLGPVFQDLVPIELRHGSAWMEWSAMGLSLGIACVGALAAYWCYLRQPDYPNRVARKVSLLYRIVLNKYWVDELYQATIVNPTVKVARDFLWSYWDVRILDGSINGLAKCLDFSSGKIKLIHSGFVRSYACWIFLGTVLILFYFSFWPH